MNVYKVTYEFYVDVGEHGGIKTAENIVDAVTEDFDYEKPVFEKVHLIYQQSIVKPRKLPYNVKSVNNGGVR